MAMMNSRQYHSPLFNATWFSIMVSFMLMILLVNVTKVPAQVQNKISDLTSSPKSGSVDSLGSALGAQEIEKKSPIPPVIDADYHQPPTSKRLRSFKEKHPNKEVPPHLSQRTKVSTVVMKSLQQIVRGLKGVLGFPVFDETSPKNAAKIESFDTVPAWGPIGSGIFVADTGKCKSVSLSSRGFTVATGVPGINSFVNVYQLIDDDWVPKGSAISVYLPPGIGSYECSGGFVSLSDDGDVVAIGAPADDRGGSPDGAVRVLEWDGNDWVQKGEDIVGKFGDGTIGSSISLSGNGETVAIGNAAVNREKYSRNICQLFQWDGTAWTQKGQTFDNRWNYPSGGFDFDLTIGWDVSMGGDGNTVAISDPYSKWRNVFFFYGYSYTRGYEGRFMVFDWNGTEWVERIEEKGGEIGDLLGYSVALSYDGQTVAAGAPSGSDEGNPWGRNEYAYLNRDSGSIRVSNRDESGNWGSMGSWIEGMDFFDTREFGTVLALSGDGSTVAGCVQSESGQIIFGYEQQSNQWKPKGLPIDTTCASIYLNHYGNIVAISDGGNGVQVYSLKERTIAAESAHPYEPNTEQKWDIDLAADFNGCAVLTMDPLSYTSSANDAFVKARLYDAEGAIIGGSEKLYGTALSEFPPTTVYGARLKIVFKSKASAEPNYGFKVYIQHCYQSSYGKGYDDI